MKEGKKLDDLLGVLPDTELAQMFGCSTRTINRRRKEKGIAACSISSEREEWTIDWSQWDHLLGVCPDTKLAEQIGCSAGAVSSRRNKLRIQKFSKGGSGKKKRFFDVSCGIHEVITN